MSRVSGLPTVGMSHRDIEAPPTVGKNGQPVPLRVPLPVRAAQLFFSRFPRVGILKSARGNVYDRLKIYKATRGVPSDIGGDRWEHALKDYDAVRRWSYVCLDCYRGL